VVEQGHTEAAAPISDPVMARARARSDFSRTISACARIVATAMIRNE
jgi:hypothetical protein